MHASDVDASPPSRIAPEEYRRAVTTLERAGRRWACELVTFRADGGWRGLFAFRPGESTAEDVELRTGAIFVERSEEEIHARARSMGRPLLDALLESAQHVRDRERSGSPFLQRWFRSVLAEHSRSGSAADEGAPTADGEAGVAGSDLEELRSLYASYRMDQVAHFIGLVDPDDFRRAVDRILDGETIDFAARDRLQLAMMVVEFIEARLPLPPFEEWILDFLAHRRVYEAYAHALHREGVLP